MKARCVPIGIVLLAVSALTAGEGRRPIWEPTTIVEPGSYFVTRDITGPGRVIDIAAQPVELDLNGFTLQGTGTVQPVIISTGDVVIRNGTIVGGAGGIIIDNEEPAVLRNLSIKNSIGAGITLDGVRDFLIERVRVVGAGGVGISAELSAGAIRDTVVDGAGGTGILAMFGTVAVFNNEIDEAGNDGIELRNCDGCTATDNRIVDPAGNGVRVTGSSGVRVAQNTVRLAGSNGIFLDGASGSSHLQANVISGCSQSGIDIFSPKNHVEGNLLTDNTGFGLIIRGDKGTLNVIRTNVARGNQGIGSCGAPVSNDFCDENGTSTAGDNFLPALY